MNSKLAKKMRKHAKMLAAGGFNYRITQEGSDLDEVVVPTEDEIYKDIQRRVSRGTVTAEDIPDYD